MLAVFELKDFILWFSSEVFILSDFCIVFDFKCLHRGELGVLNMLPCEK